MDREPAATNPDYDFEDIFEGLRTSTSLGLPARQPAGQRRPVGHPVGLRDQRHRLQQGRSSTSAASSPPRRSTTSIQLAIDLTDRSQNRYGVAFRGSKSWATDPPRLHDPVRAEGCKDYTLHGRQAAGRDELSRRPSSSPQQVGGPGPVAGPTSWTTYEYPTAPRDLGDGNAMMVLRRRQRDLPEEQARGQRAGRQPRLAPGPGRPGRQLRDQPLDLVAGHELGVQEQAGRRGCSSSGPPARRPCQGGQPRRSPTRPASRSSTARSSRPSAPSPATWRPSRRCVDSHEDPVHPADQVLRDHRGLVGRAAGHLRRPGRQVPARRARRRLDQKLNAT